VSRIFKDVFPDCEITDQMGTKSKRKLQLDAVRSKSHDGSYSNSHSDNTGLSEHQEEMQKEMNFMSESLLPLPSLMKKLLTHINLPEKRLITPVYTGLENSGT
jgi:hypothetical protein